MTLFRSQREWQAASSKDRRAECGLGWEAASAVLVCRPDENRDEPATDEKDEVLASSRILLALLFHLPQAENIWIQRDGGRMFIS